ncbi:MAG: hypothetical protein GXN91_02795 [Epsilonproteobacteria bacterium]|nr:hypothetical protein [Campylobacterota bacterium]
MSFIKRAIHLLIFTIQLVIILFYILLEEVVWEQLAKPILNYFQSLRVIEKIQTKLDRANRYIILTIFLLFLVVGEMMGLLSPIVLVKGFFILSLLFYTIKLLFIATALWIFHNQRKKILSFYLIDFLYKKILYLVAKIKRLPAYKEVVEAAKAIKRYLKSRFRKIKEVIKKKIDKSY